MLALFKTYHMNGRYHTYICCCFGLCKHLYLAIQVCLIQPSFHCTPSSKVQCVYAHHQFTLTCVCSPTHVHTHTHTFAYLTYKYTHTHTPFSLSSPSWLSARALLSERAAAAIQAEATADAPTTPAWPTTAQGATEAAWSAAEGEEGR